MPFQKGNKINIGKKQSEEHIRKRLKNCSTWKKSRYWLGKKRSKETIKKMSDSRLGKVPSLETRKKMSASAIKAGVGKWMLGRKMTEENKRKLALANIGKKMSEEAKRKIGEKNRINGLGRKASPETLKRMSEAHRGEKAYNFKKTSATRRRIRRIYKFEKWCKEIFKRDNYKCVLCSKGEELQVDHSPMYLSDIIDNLAVEQGLDNLFEKAINHDLLWDMNNGRTLCRPCHEQTENYPKNFIKK